MGRSVIGALAVALGLTGTVVTTANASNPLTPGDVVVYRVGTGTGALSSAATPVFLNEYSSSGELVESVAMPTSTSGPNKPLLASGSANSEGLLTLSANGEYLIETGYDTSVGASKVAETTDTSVPRTLGRVSASGEINTSTALTDAGNENNARGATSDDGDEFWWSGAGKKTSGGVHYATLGASTSTLMSTSDENARAVEIFDGQLYTSSDPSKEGINIATVGSGLPTTGGQVTTNLPFATAPSEPYAFTMLTLGLGSTPDTLYLADNSAGAVVKFGLIEGKWVKEGSITVAAVTGLTANDTDGIVTIYATSSGSSGEGGALYEVTDASGLGGTLSGTATQIATAPANEAFRGVAFAPDTVIGSGGPPPPPQPTITTSESSLPAAQEDPTNPTLEIAVGGEGFEPSELTVKAHSSNPSVAPESAINISGSGAHRTLTVTPGTVGDSTITLTVEAPGGAIASTTVDYGVSAYQGEESDRYYAGAGNASTAIDVGDGYMILGDDESNVLRLYDSRISGPPVETFDFTKVLPVGSGEIDIESSARAGNTLYWMGSLSNKKSGKADSDRDIVFAATISGEGANTELTYLGSYTHLRDDLIAWDEENGNPLGLAASGTEGVPSNEAGGLNDEGLEFAPGSTSTAYLAFRAPLEPPTDRNDALLVPVTNFSSLVTDGNPGTTKATFGTALEWNLGGHGIREIRRNAAGEYLVIAGTPDDSNSSFGLYSWDGNPSDQPVLSQTPIAGVAEGAWESIVSVPEPLINGVQVELIEDNGETVWYGDGLTSKTGMPTGLQKDLGRLFTIELAEQHITFESSAPSDVAVRASYTPIASASSGLSLVYSIDPASTSGACTLEGSEVSFTGLGTCVLDADQPGDSRYAPAARVSQTIQVVPAPTVTPVISATAGTNGWYVSPVTISWEVSSPVPASGCAPTTLTADTTGTVVSCTATSAGGSTSASVRIKIDQTKPLVGFSGDSGSYTPIQTVAIKCSASDPAPGSGLAQSNCPSVNAPAWTFGPGSHTLSASATDNAGNTSTAAASFTVNVTPSTLCTLTEQFVQGSTRYQQLGMLSRLIVNVLVNAGCNLVLEVAPQLKPAQKTALIGAYQQAVGSLAASGWLTGAQAATLSSFAAAL